MIEVGPTRESDVVLTFLKAEIDYSDVRDRIQQSLEALGVTRKELIDHADLDNDYENAVRALLLECYRGYLGRSGLFIGFPKDAKWRRVELEPSDFERVMYIANEGNWDSYSQRTRAPKLVAERLARGELPAHFAQKVSAIQASLKQGPSLPELVVVEGEGDTLVLMEGAHRVTAYASLKWNANIPAIIGSSPLMCNWHWYAYR